MRFRLFPLVFHAVAVIALLLGGCAPHTEPGQSKASSFGAVTGMHHLLLTVADPPRSVQFYRDVLGMQVDYSTAEFRYAADGKLRRCIEYTSMGFREEG